MSPSIPTISVTWVIGARRRFMRVWWTIRLRAEATCSRIELGSRSIPAISIIVSTRDSASRGEFEWMVVIDPSWPVFMACIMSGASTPRTSPTTMLSGSHPQGVPDKVADRDLAACPRCSAVGTRGAHHVRLLEPELRLSPRS